MNGLVILESTLYLSPTELLIAHSVSLATAYLLGSIPFGYLIVKLKSGADIRATGSGGTGATNVTRKAGKLAGVITLILDALKGAAAVLLAQALWGETRFTWEIAAAAVMVVVGHCYPIWLSYRGGKGVATALGVFTVLVPFAVLPALLLFVITVALTRYVSLGSICGALMVPLSVAAWHLSFAKVEDFLPLTVALCATTALIIMKHRENIQRLLAGTENKLRLAK